MSGSFEHSVNNYWESPTNSIAPAVFFWMWLHYINDHSGLVVRGVGTGKATTGTTIPTAWLTWDPWTTPTPPMGDNSWVVFEAVNADVLLNGGGSDPWQAKLQFTLATAFDDCNYADDDYQEESSTYCCCMRVSPAAGWDNTGTVLDFAPSGGEDISDNLNIMNDSDDGKFVLDIVGDDDSIWWVGSCFDGAVPDESGVRARGGHVGMLSRRSSGVDYPFLFMAGRIRDAGEGSGYNAIMKVDDYPAYYMFTAPSAIVQWPSFSLWKDGTKVERHRIDTWDIYSRSRLKRDPVTGGTMILGCIVAQEDNTANRYAMVGELRLFGSTAYEFAQGALAGDNGDWKQVCYGVPTQPGMLLKWPAGVAPIWP